MQRDEFLPLKVIRQELASGQVGAKRRRSSADARNAISLSGTTATLTVGEVVERAGANEKMLREIEEYGIVQPHGTGEAARYDDTDVEILRAAAELGRYGVSGPQPQGLPDLRLPRGRSARAAARWVAALALGLTARRGPRASRGSCRHLHAALASAAGPRPAAS